MLLDAQIFVANLTAQVQEQPIDVAWGAAIGLATYFLVATALRQRARIEAMRVGAGTCAALAACIGFLAYRFDYRDDLLSVAIAAVSCLLGILSLIRWPTHQPIHSLADTIEAVGLERLDDVQISTRHGAVAIDTAAYAEGVILAVVCRPYRGAIFGNAHSRHWTVVKGRSKMQFSNPMAELETQVAAIRGLVGNHTAGIIVFPNKTRFPNGRPSCVVTVAELPRVLELLVSSGRDSIESRRAWKRLKMLANGELAPKSSPTQDRVAPLDRREPSF